jgi:hypothetical protein
LRLAAAVIIFGVIILLSAPGGVPGQAVRDGVSYLLIEDYDISGCEKSIREVFSWLPDLPALGIKRDLEVQVSTSGDLACLPVSGKLVRGFGWQKDDANWPYYHEGVELSVAKGALVRAVLPGKVVRVITLDYRFRYIIDLPIPWPFITPGFLPFATIKQLLPISIMTLCNIYQIMPTVDQFPQPHIP